MEATLIGWIPGLKKVSLTEAIKEYSRLNLKEAKMVVDNLLGGYTVTIEFENEEKAAAFKTSAQSLGAICDD